MRQRRAVQWDRNQAPARNTCALPDRLWHLVRLAESGTDPSLAVPNDDDGAEAEATPALDHLGNAVDEHDALCKLAVAAIASVSVPTSKFSHYALSFACCRIARIPILLLERCLPRPSPCRDTEIHRGRRPRG